MNLQTTKETAEQIIDLASPFYQNAGQRVVGLLRGSHAECVDGANKADMAQNHRLSIILGLPGLTLPTGPVVAEPKSLIQPKNTTWLKFQGIGREFSAPVNCVKFHGLPNTYLLARSDVSDLADFSPTGRLFDLAAPELMHFLIGIRWTFRPTDRSMSFLVRLLCGSCDFDRRIFYGYAERDIAKLDTRTDEVRFGHSAQPVGPEPKLQSKKRNQDS